MCSHQPHTKCLNMTLSGRGTVLAAVYRLANTRLLPGIVGTQCSVRIPEPCTASMTVEPERIRQQKAPQGTVYANYLPVHTAWRHAGYQLSRQSHSTADRN